MTYVIVYSSRHPQSQQRLDGSWGCAGCGGDLPKRRRTWCSNACFERFDPRCVITAVKERDKGICQSCGFDTDTREPNCTGYMRRVRDPEYDHIVPFCEGGLTVLENMRTLCDRCHRARTKTWHGERAAARRPQKSLLTP